MSLRTTILTATAAAVAAVATSGILSPPAGAATPALSSGTKCDRGNEKVREGTVMHTRLGTWVCRKGRWTPAGN